MSGFLPASVAIRKRLRRALSLAPLLWGLGRSSTAFAQIPVLAQPVVEADDVAEAPAPAPPSAPLPPVAPAPAPAEPPARLQLIESDEAVPERALGAAPTAESKQVPLRYTLEAIVLRGNTRTQRRVVLRYVPFKPGNVFDVDDPEVELSRFRLLGTGFFRDVQYSLKKGSEGGLVVLVIDVTERNTIVINDVSMGLAADDGRNGRVQ